MAALLQIQ